MPMTTKIILFLVFLSLTAAGSLRSGCPASCSECSRQFRKHCIECKPGHYLEKGECKPCHDSCNFCNGPFKDDCLPENLHNILNTHRLLASGDVEPLPNSVILVDGFTLSFDYTADNSEITILLNFTLSQGWFGIGFGASMEEGDYIVCIPGNGDITCNDYYSETESTPEQDSVLGGTDNVVQLGYSISGRTTLVKVQRKLNTGDNYDNVITRGLNNMLWAYHDTSKEFIFHSYYDSGMVDLTPINSGSSGLNSSNSTNGTSNPVPAPRIVEKVENPLEKTHGIIIFCGWGLLIDLGLIIIALGRKYSISVWIHVITAFYTVITTVVTSAIMIQYRKYGGPDKLSNSHFAIAVAMLALMLFQMLSGSSMIVLSNRRKISNPFFKWRLSHRLNGMLLYILAKANIFIGVYLHGNNWLPWMIPTQATLITLNILVRLWMSYRNTKYQPLYSKTSTKLINSPAQNNLVADINNGKSREELVKAYPKIKFAYLFNRIYDLSSFEHPGGNFIISAVKGREMGRFLYGAYPLETLNQKNKYLHKTTEIAILNKYFIGEINQSQSTLLICRAQNTPTVTESFTEWTFVKKTLLTKTIANFEFRSPMFLVKNDMKGVSWFGKHFYIAKNHVKGPIRPYTTCLSLGESWTNYRKKAVEYFDSKMQQNGNENTAFMETLRPTTDNINFVIKKYHNPNSLALSEFMHTELDGSKSILMNGPQLHPL